MFKVVRLRASDGTEFTLFTGCTETGFSAKDVITMPGAYEECTGTPEGTPLKLRKLQGTIGAYNTKLYALCVEDSTKVVQDITGSVVNILTMPATAANAMMQAMSEEMRDNVRQASEAVHFYEGITEKSKVCLDDEALSEIPQSIREGMKSAKQHYVLRDTENQEVFQKSCESEFGVVLPSVVDIHDDNLRYSALDIIRALMPYRRPGSPSTYETIYHTPYFRVGVNAGILPKHLDWVYGFESNDLLDIQPNERRMQKNLYTLYCSDISRYVQEIVTGAFFNTDYGHKFARMGTKTDREVVDRLLKDIRNGARFEDTGNSVTCDISSSEVDNLFSIGWETDDVGRALLRSLQMDDGFLEQVIRSTHPARRVITTRNQLFTIPLSDEQSSKFTSLLIELGFISSELNDFMLTLCKCAYEACWGHTGVAHAVPALISQSMLSNQDKEYSRFLVACESGKGVSAGEFMNMYLNSYQDPLNGDETAEAAAFAESAEGGDDSLGIAFNYYLTQQNYRLLGSGEIEMRTLLGMRDNESDAERLNRLNAEPKETRIIERWRAVNGEAKLDYFLTTAHAQTADVRIYIQAFLKLCRWGSRRPQNLVLQDHPEIRHVFDLNAGVEADNAAVVREEDLVKVNGCDYSLAGFLNTTSNRGVSSEYIIGFILKKDYGTVQKTYLASWEDIAEMVATNTINIGEFKVNAPVDTSNLTGIETFEKASYDIYASDSNTAEGLKLKVSGRELSKIVLLPHPGITQDRAYLKAIMSETVDTIRDRQYDNLDRYLKCLRQFYDSNKDRLANIRSTMDLQELALLYDELMKDGPKKREDTNARAASNTMTKLSLTTIEYIDCPLVGKFVLVNDGDNLTIKDNTWDPMTFTDPRLASLNPGGRNSIVLLMLKTNDCWLLCRKDIKLEELDIVRTPTGTKPNNVSYTSLRGAVTQMLNGGGAKIKGVPIKFHISAKLPEA